eukprot:gene24532-30888_t
MGGLTAWVLQNYLARKMFPGYDTNESWISGLVTANTPFNGVLKVHSKGLDHSMPPLVRWGSHGQWGMDNSHRGSLLCLFHALLGFCIHSTTDNVSYDASVHAQRVWGSELVTFPSCYYVSVVGLGTTLPHINSENMTTCGRLLQYIGEIYLRLSAGHIPQCVGGGLSSAHWSEGRHDGLLNAHTQEYPKLHTSNNSKIHKNLRFTDQYHKHHVNTHSPHNVASAVLSPPLLLETRGCWHHIQQQDVTHLSAAFGDRDVWTCLWTMSATITLSADRDSKSAEDRRDSSGNKTDCISNDTKSCASPIIDTINYLKQYRADTQQNLFSLQRRFRVLHGDNFWVCLTAALLALHCVVMHCSAVTFTVTSSTTNSFNEYSWLIQSVFLAVIVQLCVLFASLTKPSSSPHSVDSDMVEITLSVLRVVALLLVSYFYRDKSAVMTHHSLALTASLQSALYLFEAFLLALLSRRSGIYENTLLRTKLILVAETISL